MSPPLPHPLTTKLSASWPAGDWADVTTLVATSGGPDSVALLLGLVELQQSGQGRLIVAHYDHGWRAASADEQRFVVELAGRLDIECQTGRAASDAKVNDDPRATEAGARSQRYAFLRTTAERVGARFVVTGHTADDQAETILHRILRGTGVAGLTGIPRARRLSPATTVVRPLLAVSRAEVLDFLAQRGATYCQDATNADLRFTRNRIRQDLLPKLATEFNPDVVAALVRLGQTAEQVDVVIRPLVAELFDKAVRADVDGVTIRVAALADAADYLIREVLVRVWQEQGWPLQGMGAAQWQTLVNLIRTAEPAQVLPGIIKATREPDRLDLRPTAEFPENQP